MLERAQGLLLALEHFGVVRFCLEGIVAFVICTNSFFDLAMCITSLFVGDVVLQGSSPNSFYRKSDS